MRNVLGPASPAESGRARLASYGRHSFGAKVPDREYDFGCCEKLLGGELAEKGQARPRQRDCVGIADRAEPGNFNE